MSRPATTANDRLLSSTKAGSDYEAHWKCHRCGYEWQVKVSQRTIRQTRCQRCSTERADGKNSLAAIHPDLVREWDAAAKAPLRPERIKATYDKAVVWRCRDDPPHPAYRMSPVTRAKLPTGCPICRKKRPAKAVRPLARPAAA